MPNPQIPYDPFFGISLPTHNWVPAPRYLMRRDRILNYLRNRKQKGTLLEIGCGTGALIEDCRRLGYRCDGLEISEDALKIARSVHQKNDDVHLYSEFCDSLTEKYDILISCEVIEHIEDDLSALKLWASTLKADGVAVISSPSNPANFNALDLWAGHFRRYTHKSMTNLCENAGLEIIRFESYGYPLVDLTEKIRGWICKRQLKKQKGTGMQAATEKSGIDRGVESKLYPILTSSLGRFVFKKSMQLQERYLDREIGNGMLCIAKRK